jgi:hypothetical protein
LGGDFGGQLLRLVIYEWDAWQPFMLVRMVPEAIRLTARLGETADEVLQRLPPSVDAFAFHLDMTSTAHMPAGRDALVGALTARGVVALNAAVTDISKVQVQAQCRAFGLPTAAADPEGDPAEQVIVKTNLNFGGRGERELLAGGLAMAGSARLSSVMTDWTGYQVVPREQVPAAWWHDPTLVIERFIDNRSHHLYRVNFVGDRAVILRLTNPHPIKKIRNSTARLDVYCRVDDLRRGWVTGIDQSVARATAHYLDRSGMDFGALEIIPDDAGRAFIIDVNSTCYGSIMNLRMLAYLRRGLFTLVEARAEQLGRRMSSSRVDALPTWRMLVSDAWRIVTDFAASRTPPNRG